MTQLKHLFSPIRIKSMELKNRAVMPAMATTYGKTDSMVSDRLIKYLARRAQGGTGLIFTEVCAVDPRGRLSKNEVGIWSDEFIPGLARITEAVHRDGGKVGVQLHHAGRETSSSILGVLPEAPSPIPSPLLRKECEEMSIQRIGELVEAYGASARRAKQAGFDTLEIHGAHGYLPCQFLSPFSNHRSDRYGGSDENRSRFLIEIIESVRNHVGPDFPVMVRVSAEELVPGGYDLTFMKWLAPQLVAAGADALHVSIGVYTTPGNLSIAVMDTEPGFNLFRVRAIKKLVDVPVIGVGRIHDPRIADAAIALGDADLISFGRQQLTDPDMMNKAQRGEFDDIRLCLACNQGCFDRLSFERKAITCAINPLCGREDEEGPPKVPSPKRIWVIGAGPAGLSAALAALERGHRVELFEREDEPGGQLRPASQAPNKGGYLNWVDWITRQIKKQGGDIRYKHEVTEERMRTEKPDAVILATGALPVTPDIPGLEGGNVFDARDVLMGKVKLQKSAVILGAGYVGMETADYLISRGVSVIILEMKSDLPVIKYTARVYWLQKRLRDSGGKLILGATVTKVDPEAVVYSKDGEEHRLRPAPMVVKALGASPESTLLRLLEDLQIPHRIVGDAKSPRRLIEAVHEGHDAGLEI